MNFKKNWKRFWTLSSAREGFTLVELIVVIAILAILAGVAVPAYSGYVTKANKQADITLANEVKQALALAYYSDPDFEGGVVVLSLGEAPAAEGLEDAMAKAFGEDWQNNDALKLQYNGWSADFEGSSFQTAEGGLSGLVGTVDTLTTALAGFLEIADVVDGNFADYAANLGAEDAQSKANAAVFYVADVTGQMTSEDINNANQAMIDMLVNAKYNDNYKNDESSVRRGTDTLTAMNQYTNGSTIGSAALLYAMATGFAEYAAANGNTDPMEQLTAATQELKDSSGSLANTTEAFTTLFETFDEMLWGNDGKNMALAEEYAGSALAKDAAAYADALKTVSAAQDGIIANKNGSLSGTGYFNNDYVNNLLSSYSQGGVFVFAIPDKNGVMQFTSTIDEE